MSKQLIVVPPGLLSSHDKNRLTRAGFVWLESDAPDAVRVVASGVLALDLEPTELLVAAARTIRDTDWNETRQLFGKCVADAIIAKHAQEASAE